LFLFSSLALSAQEYKWSLVGFGGIDFGGAVPIPISAASSDAEGMPLVKPAAGLEVQYSHSERWQFGAGLFYHNVSLKAVATVISQAYWSDDRSYATYFSGEAHSEIELQQFEIPLSVHYKFNEKWSAVMGGYFSYIIHGEFNTEGKNGWISTNKEDTDTAPLPGTQNMTSSLNEDLDNYDIGLFLGYEYNFWRNFTLWSRFNVGFKSIFKPEFDNIDYEMYQFRFSMGLAYTIAEW